MRIVIDLQGAQGNNRLRGIGRFSLSLAQAIAQNAKKHEILVVLNGLFPETIQPIRNAFYGLLPQKNIHVWYAPGPVAAVDSANAWRKETAELVREAFIASLNPDLVLITSIFEGFNDNSITSIGKFTTKIPTAVVMYDLIPLVYRNHYLQGPALEKWYENKVGHLRSAQLILADSESARQEAIQYLNYNEDSVFNILAAADIHFKPQLITSDQESAIRQRYGMHRPFIMNVGGNDYRKNVEGLIRAYAKLPALLRSKYQLVLVFTINSEKKESLKNFAIENGLAEDDLLITGFISEEDLVVLYNLCKLFVFPSWREGFGLPVLEAMSCGCAVIGSNTTSIPEVIGREDALFDPMSDVSIAMKIEQVLTDDSFCEALKKHGIEQAKKFSWDYTAHRAIEALENFYIKTSQHEKSISILSQRPKLAYLSPLPPQPSGVSDYSAELLPALSRYYEIDVIVDQEIISIPWINANCTIRNVEYFKNNFNRYHRIVYHFGNSFFHRYMFDLLNKIPGIVVLHDFFLSGITELMERKNPSSHAFYKALYQSHGYLAVFEYFQKGSENAVSKYPVNLNIIEKAIGVILHSESSKILAKKWLGSLNEKNWSIIPLLRAPFINDNRMNARSALNIKPHEFIICSFGYIGMPKLNHRLLDSFLASKLAKDKNIRLIFVGETPPCEYRSELTDKIIRHGIEDRCYITGFADMGIYRQYLLAADLAVQLRSLSRGETSAAVLDCMNYGVPTIVNAHGSMADLPDHAVLKLADEFENINLIEALELLYSNQKLREEMSEKARQFVREQHSPRKCANQYFEAIENFYNDACTNLLSLEKAIIGLDKKPENFSEFLPLAKSIARSIPPRFAQRQIFIDISELVRCDVKSGIQRVVCNILLQLLINPPENIRIEPVYADAQKLGYRYARSFTLDFLGCSKNILNDSPIEYRNGDIFLGLDLQPQVISAQQQFYQEMQHCGVKVWFVMYDLLPIRAPQYFLESVVAAYTNWTNVVRKGDGIICISKTVAHEVSDWIEKNPNERLRDVEISWFYQGADISPEIKTSSLKKALSKNELNVLDVIRKVSSFLMVGTIEPRKGHQQTLAAFEQLWREGYQINLIIVGKQGWMVKDLVEKLWRHSELNKRLFWLNGISDEYLEAVYKSSTGLIAASYGEGFGLPLVEAAQHKLPIIARNIPVFKEITAGHAFYFEGDEPEILAKAIKEWLPLFEKNAHPKSDRIPWQTWKQSAKQLLDIILEAGNIHPQNVGISEYDSSGRSLTQENILSKKNNFISQPRFTNTRYSSKEIIRSVYKIFLCFIAPSYRLPIDTFFRKRFRKLIQLIS